MSEHDVFFLSEHELKCLVNSLVVVATTAVLAVEGFQCERMEQQNEFQNTLTTKTRLNETSLQDTLQSLKHWHEKVVPLSNRLFESPRLAISSLIENWKPKALSTDQKQFIRNNFPEESKCSQYIKGLVCVAPFKLMFSLIEKVSEELILAAEQFDHGSEKNKKIGNKTMKKITSWFDLCKTFVEMHSELPSVHQATVQQIEKTENMFKQCVQMYRMSKADSFTFNGHEYTNFSPGSKMLELCYAVNEAFPSIRGSSNSPPKPRLSRKFWDAKDRKIEMDLDSIREICDSERFHWNEFIGKFTRKHIFGIDTYYFQHPGAHKRSEYEIQEWTCDFCCTETFESVQDLKNHDLTCCGPKNRFSLYPKKIESPLINQIPMEEIVNKMEKMKHGFKAHHCADIIIKKITTFVVTRLCENDHPVCVDEAKAMSTSGWFRKMQEYQQVCKNDIKLSSGCNKGRRSSEKRIESTRKREKRDQTPKTLLHYAFLFGTDLHFELMKVIYHQESKEESKSNNGKDISSDHGCKRSY